MAKFTTEEVYNRNALQVLDGPQSAPEIVQKPRDIFAYEGDDLTFQVKVSGNPIPKIFWFKNGQPLKPTQRCRIEHENGVVNLHIHMLLNDDAACYTLLTENNYGLAIFSIKLNINYVQDENVNIQQTMMKRTEQHYVSDYRDDMVTSSGIKPNFYLIPYDIETLDGQIVRFECRVSGRPEPEITWYKGDHLIHDSDHFKCVVNEEGNYALLIMGADPEDAGTYKCVASNSVGSSSFTVKLSIIQRQQTVAPKFVERFMNTNVREGESVVLHCRAVGTPMPQLTWQKDGIQIDSNPPDCEIKEQEGASTLFLNNISVRAAGWYQCTALSPNGSVATRARLNVESTFQPPKGEPVKLLLPKTHRRIVPESEKYETITLRHVEKVYEHYSSAEYDSQAHTVVQQHRPAFSTHLRDVVLSKGDRAHFEAHLSSFDYTDLAIEWYLNGILLDSQDSRVITTNRYGYIALTLMNVSPQDSGIVTCKLRNQYGEAVTSATLKCAQPKTTADIPEYTERYEDVEDSEFYRHQREIEETRTKIAPIFVRPLESNISSLAGGDLVFEAQVTPVNDPTLRVEWIINGQPLLDSNRTSATFNFGLVSLTIKQLQSTDSGLYVVKATSASGEASSTASLKVLPGKDSKGSRF